MSYFNNNPFIEDDDAASSYSVDSTPPWYPPPPPPAAMSSLKLQPFWSDAPVAWFASAEAQFQIRGVVAQRERFCHVVAALDKESFKKIVHLVTNPHHIAPYDGLKEALVASHQLTDFQRVEQLVAMEPLGGRKPSELLADMWELCPADQHNNIFFVALFLQRLPKEIRVLLTHEDHSDLRRLAAHADRLVAYGGRQAGSVCAAAAAVEQPEGLVAAIGGKKQQQHKRNKQPPPLPPRPQGSQQKQNKEATPSSLARQTSGLCFYHWAYGEKAHSCKEPCTWQGN